MLQAFAIFAILPVLSLALFLVLVRLIKGPNLSDRIIALDIISIIGAGFIAAIVIGTGQTAYLDVAIVLGLLVFLGTVAFARFLERRV